MSTTAKGPNSIEALLQCFDAKHVASLIKHFNSAVEAFEGSAWEECILKAGKFVEAVLKALGKHAKVSVPTGRKFKVDAIITQLAQTSTIDDSLRLLIPRACRFVYDVASNRGARHDPEEIDPNKMDAAMSVQTVSWVLAELVRFSQKGSIHPDDAVRATDALVEKKFPAIENIDGRIYVDIKGLSATEVALVILDYRFPARTQHDYLVQMLVRHGFKAENAKVAMTRIRNFVDDDGKGNLKLRSPGRRKVAEVRTRQ